MRGRQWALFGLVGGALASNACATLKRDPYPGTFRVGFLNDRREHLFDRPAVGALAVGPPRHQGAWPAAVPPLPATRPIVLPTLVRSAEVPPLPPALSTLGSSADRVAPPLAPSSRRGFVPSLPDRAEPEQRVAPSHLAAWLRHNESPHLRRERIATFAASLVGARRIVANGRRYAANCSDFVRAVYSIEGIDLYRWPSRPRGFSGVRGMYGLARMSHGLHFKKTPEVGDLVFFHHTYDFNRNKRIDDFLSHVGVIEKVDADGTVHYIDRSSGRIKRNRMHVARPHLWRDPASLKVLNSYVRSRRKGDPPGTRYLSGDLFAGFGTLIR